MDRALPEARAIAYAYPIQPGSYAILRTVHHFVGIPYIEIFGILTAGGALCFLVTASHLGARITHAHWLAVLLLLLTAQEMSAAGFYANTSALAAALITGAIILTLEEPSLRRSIISAVLIAVAGWIRMDALLIAPAILATCYSVEQTASEALKRTSIIAIGSFIVLAVLLFVSHTSFLEAWQTYEERGKTAHLNLLLRKGWLGLSAVTTVAVAVAWTVSAVQKRWTLILICFCGSLPSFAVYGPNLASTKYLYYAIPFLIFPLATVAGEFEAKNLFRKMGVGIFVSSILAEALIGVRTTYPSSRRYIPDPWLLGPLTFHRGDRNIELGLGEGEIIGTDDAFRLRTGWAFAPRVWKTQKRRMKSELAALHAAMRQDNLKIVATTYLSHQVVIGQLLAEGFYCDGPRKNSLNNDAFTMEWRKGNRTVEILGVADSPHEEARFTEASSARNPKLFLNDRGRNVARSLKTFAKGWSLLSPDEDGLLTIYRSRAERL